MNAHERYARYQTAIRGEPFPLAIVDLDAFEANVATLLERVRGSGKTLRLASKSVRCIELLRRVARQGGDLVRGVMAYSAAEARFLVEQGFDDVLLGYPTLSAADARLLAEANLAGATVSTIVDSVVQLQALEAEAAKVGAVVPVVIEADASYRLLGGRIHVGVRRSPLHEADEVVTLAERVGAHPHLRFHGVMAYEAQIAGVPDLASPSPVTQSAMRLMKAASRRALEVFRKDIALGLRMRGLPQKLFNGGGTGSLAWSSQEAALTEVTAGSGFLDSHLFDHYRDLPLRPAALFALQVVRRPCTTMVTCHGGGFVASGAPGPDRLPRPALPEGLALTELEGAGEVQTPLVVPPGLDLALGAPVFFRHAKAGELAEHFREYLLVRGDRIEARAPTYRGMGQCFL